MKNIQIGGKGTIRHKKKKFIRNEDKLKFEIKNIITNINLKISYLGNEKKKELTEILDKDIEKLIIMIKKEETNKKNFLEIKNQKKNYFYKHFFYIENNIIILLKDNIFEFIIDNFQGNSRKLCFDFLKIIYNLLQSSKKKIEVDDIDKEKIEKDIPYTKELFTESLLHFDISQDKKIHFTEIKKIYDDKKQKNISDDIHFYRLKSQYSDYLNDN